MLKKLFIIAAVCFAIAFAEDNVLKSPVNKKSSTEKPESSSQTPTTVAPTNSTPAETTTTTIKPSTITPPKTSPAPTSPTTEPPTTLAPPQKGHYDIKEDNVTCLLVDLAIQISMTVDNETWGVDVPVNISTLGSSCSNVSDDLLLSWNYAVNKTVQLSFKFEMSNTSQKYMISSIVLTYPYLNETLNLNSSQPLFPTTVAKSYRCEKEQEVKLSEATNISSAVLKVSHLQFQAFHFSTDGKYGAAEDCADSSSTDIVPIAVGCALVVLIIVVLVAYLVGRWRSQAPGYLSM